MKENKIICIIIGICLVAFIAFSIFTIITVLEKGRLNKNSEYIGVITAILDIDQGGFLKGSLALIEINNKDQIIYKFGYSGYKEPKIGQFVYLRSDGIHILRNNNE